MKKIIFFILILPTFLFSQNTVTRNLGDFNKIKIYDLINVKLVQSDLNRVEISGTHANEVQLINKYGKLKIRMSLPKIFKGDNVLVTLYYKSIQAIDANEGAYIYSDNLIQVNSFDCRAQEGARVEINIKTSYLESRAYSGAIINLNGEAQAQLIKVNTGGIVKAQNLKTTDSEVIIRAGGEVEVYASGKLTADIKAGGKVYVYGDPKMVSKSKLLGGKVTLMN